MSAVTVRGLAAALLILSLALGLGDLARVPFHPDESTQVHMSQDFVTFLLEGRPAVLAWRPGAPPTPEARYRLLDAPVPRYLIGLAAALAGFSRADLNADWAWDASWQTNLAEGRLPQTGLPLAARAPAAVLSALAVALVAAIGLLARGPGVGLLAGLLLVVHPLLLLHGRRAMAEGPLLFASALALLAGIVFARRLDAGPRAHSPGVGSGREAWRSLLAGALTVGALAGLAVACKQSAGALIPAALAPTGLALWGRPGPRGRRLGESLLVILAGGAAAGLVFLALNPVLWAAPLQAAAAMVAARAGFVQDQLATLSQLAPAQVLPTVGDRLRAALAQLYLQPPAVWDLPVANHLGYLEPQARAYLAVPLYQGRPAAGALLLGLSTAGLAFSALRLGRDRLGPATRAEQGLWAWGLATLAFTLAAVPVDWQRYFLPLLPPVCLFAALGAEGLAGPLASRWRSLHGKSYDQPR